MKNHPVLFGQRGYGLGLWKRNKIWLFVLLLLLQAWLTDSFPTPVIAALSPEAVPN
jgi:hypothetical protein